MQGEHHFVITPSVAVFETMTILAPECSRAPKPVDGSPCLTGQLVPIFRREISERDDFHCAVAVGSDGGRLYGHFLTLSHTAGAVVWTRNAHREVLEMIAYGFEALTLFLSGVSDASDTEAITSVSAILKGAPCGFREHADRLSERVIELVAYARRPAAVNIHFSRGTLADVSIASAAAAMATAFFSSLGVI